jgi:hypothetical protein
VEAIAAAAGLPVGETDFDLRELFSLSFLRRGSPEGYRLIPLLQTFACEKMAGVPIGGFINRYSFE